MSTSFWKIQLFYFVWRSAVALLHLENMPVCFTSVWGNVPVLFYSILGNMPVCFTSFWETTPVLFLLLLNIWRKPTYLTSFVNNSHEMCLNLKFGNLRYLHVSNLQVLLAFLILKSRFYSKKNMDVTCFWRLHVWQEPFWENQL